MRKTGDKRRWWRFGGWVSNMPEPETDMGKLKARTRRLACAVAAVTGFSAVSLFSSGSVGLLRPFAALTGASVGLCLLAVTVVNARPRGGLRVQALAIGSALFPGLGMAWLLATLAWLSLLVTLVSLVWFLILAWKSLEPHPLSRRVCLVSHVVNLAFRDLLKGSLLLLAVLYVAFLASTPFRPLAIRPPPAELLARYPAKPFVPRGDGKATRLLCALDPSYAHMVSTNNPVDEAMQAKWDALSEAMQDREAQLRTNLWQNVTGPKDNEALAALQPDIDRFSNAVHGEDLVLCPQLMVGKPFCRNFVSWGLIMRYLKGRTTRLIDEGGVGSAIGGVKQLSVIGQFATRSDDVVSGLVGRLLSGRILLKQTVRLFEHQSVLSGAAGDYERYLSAVPQVSCRLANAMQNEKAWCETCMRFMFAHRYGYAGAAVSQRLWKKYWVDTGTGMYNRGLRLLWWAIVLSPLSGNALDDVLTSLSNGVEWERLSLSAALDSKGPDLVEVRRIKGAAIVRQGWRRFLHRGWLGASFVPCLSERLVGREWQCSAELALARAVVMLGAYRAETGRPADSLDAVAGRFGWEAPSVPLSDQKIAYARFPPGTLGGSPAEAYLLACPGDGRAVPKESGRALLVVRNPAFGALPFRQYHWTKLKEKEARGGNVSTSGVWVDESADRAGVGAAADGFRLPLGLLSPKPEAWNRAEFFLENQGWEIGG